MWTVGSIGDHGRCTMARSWPVMPPLPSPVGTTDVSAACEDGRSAPAETKVGPVAAIHYRNRSDPDIRLGSQSEGLAMASGRSRLRGAVRTLLKRRERTRRRIRRRSAPR